MHSNSQFSEAYHWFVPSKHLWFSRAMLLPSSSSSLTTIARSRKGRRIYVTSRPIRCSLANNNNRICTTTQSEHHWSSTLERMTTQWDIGHILHTHYTHALWFAYFVENSVDERIIACGAQCLWGYMRLEHCDNPILRGLCESCVEYLECILK